MSKFSLLSKAKFNNVDFAKVCMAVMVVALHTGVYCCFANDLFNQVGKALVDLAVPFFFIASGFFLWRKIADATLNEKVDRITKWGKHIFMLYCIWSLVYLPYAIYGFVRDDLSLFSSIALYVRNFIFVGENFWSWPLWYLLAMIVAAVIIFLLVKVGLKTYQIFIVALLLATSGIVIDAIHAQGGLDGYFSVFKTTRNGFFVGFPYIVMGMFIAEYGVISSKYWLATLFAIGFVLKVVGAPYLSWIVNYLLFALVIQMNIKARSGDFYRDLRLASVVIYFTHMLWVGLVTLLYPGLAPYWMFLIVLLLSFATAYLVIRNKETAVVKFCFR